MRRQRQCNRATQASTGIQELPGSVVGAIWPEDRFVIGLRVNKWLRAQLRLHGIAVLLKSQDELNLSERPWLVSRIRCDMARHGRYAQSVSMVVGEPCKMTPMDRKVFLNGLVQALSDSLSRNVQTISLRDCIIRDKGAAELAQSMRNSKLLTSLNLAGNVISSVGGAHLALALEGCPGLKHLNVAENSLGAQTAEVIARCPSLQTVEIQGNALGEDGALSVAQALRRTKSIIHLNAARCHVQSAGAAALARSLSTSAPASLRHLDLSFNNIGLAGALSLSGLASCSQLEHLNLSMNSLGADGAEAMSEWLPNCAGLRCLDVSSNSLQPEGGRRLAHSLAQCSALECLDVSGNCVRNAGASALLAHMATLPNLTSLNLGRNGIQALFAEEDVDTVFQGLKKCVSLTKLELQGNNIGDCGAQALSSALEESNNLEQLGVAGCWIGDKGGRAIADLFARAPRLRRVELQLNDISIATQRAMMQPPA